MDNEVHAEFGLGTPHRNNDVSSRVALLFKWIQLENKYKCSNMTTQLSIAIMPFVKKCIKTIEIGVFSGYCNIFIVLYMIHLCISVTKHWIFLQVIENSKKAPEILRLRGGGRKKPKVHIFDEHTNKTPPRNVYSIAILGSSVVWARHATFHPAHNHCATIQNKG